MCVNETKRDQLESFAFDISYFAASNRQEALSHCVLELWQDKNDQTRDDLKHPKQIFSFWGQVEGASSLDLYLHLKRSARDANLN